jgi:hypothetical protein
VREDQASAVEPLAVGFERAVVEVPAHLLLEVVRLADEQVGAARDLDDASVHSVSPE